MTESDRDPRNKDGPSTEARLNILERNLDQIDFKMLEDHNMLWVRMMQVILTTFGGIFLLLGASTVVGIMSTEFFYDLVPQYVHLAFVGIALFSFLIYAVSYLTTLYFRRSERKASEYPSDTYDEQFQRGRQNR